jgi:GTPase
VAKPLVALVGRANVGKSTLFNRIIGQRLAIIEDEPGTTRDRIYAAGEWNGREFSVIDTGGIQLGDDGDMVRRVRDQAKLAISEADVVVFLVDSRGGATSEDLEIADMLRASSKPVLLAANKADNETRRLDSSDFYQLGLGEVTPISAFHGTGTGDLLDEIVGHFPPADAEEELAGIGIAIVGRPNVGKSSLLNAIIGTERSIVSDQPGTTRDVIDTAVEHQGERLVLLDTAGIRRRGRVERGIEYYSVIRALRAIDRAEVALVVLDASEGITSQDTHLAGYVRDAKKGIVLVANKWDLVSPRDSNAQREFTERVRAEFKFIPYAPIHFTSAKTGRGVKDLLDIALKIHYEREQRVPTARLNDTLQETLAAHPPPSVRGRRLRILYATQAGTNPPTFVFFVNDPLLLHFGYERHLENRLRATFGFEGTPVRLVFRPRSENERSGREGKG